MVWYVQINAGIIGVVDCGRQMTIVILFIYCHSSWLPHLSLSLNSPLNVVTLSKFGRRKKLSYLATKSEIWYVWVNSVHLITKLYIFYYITFIAQILWVQQRSCQFLWMRLDGFTKLLVVKFLSFQPKDFKFTTCIQSKIE